MSRVRTEPALCPHILGSSRAVGVFSQQSGVAWVACRVPHKGHASLSITDTQRDSERHGAPLGPAPRPAAGTEVWGAQLGQWCPRPVGCTNTNTNSPKAIEPGCTRYSRKGETVLLALGQGPVCPGSAGGEAGAGWEPRQGGAGGAPSMAPRGIRSTCCGCGLVAGTLPKAGAWLHSAVSLRGARARPHC